MRRLNMGFTPYARAILGLYTLCECKIGVKNPPYPAADTRHLQRASTPPPGGRWREGGGGRREEGEEGEKKREKINERRLVRR